MRDKREKRGKGSRHAAGLRPETEREWQREVDRCLAEITECESLLFAGHPDIEGLVLAVADWSAELRILQGMRTNEEPPPDSLIPAAVEGGTR